VQDNRVGRQVQSRAVVRACLVATAWVSRDGRAQGVGGRAEQPLDAVADAVAVFVAVAGDQVQFVDARLRAPLGLHHHLQRLHGRVERARVVRFNCCTPPRNARATNPPACVRTRT
jgi:hypothetical protein